MAVSILNFLDLDSQVILGKFSELMSSSLKDFKSSQVKSQK